MTFSALLLYGYAVCIPVNLWLILTYLKEKLSLTSLLCLYGYSLFVFIPVAVRPLSLSVAEPRCRRPLCTLREVVGCADAVDDRQRDLPVGDECDGGGGVHSVPCVVAAEAHPQPVHPIVRPPPSLSLS